MPHFLIFSHFFLFLIECAGTWQVETAMKKMKKEKENSKENSIFLGLLFSFPWF
jgi:hypothetical protein